MELKFGPYLPGVDSRWTGAGPGPYAMVFGEVDEYGEFDGAIRQGLLSVLGFEWQFINLGGPLSVGTTIGYFRDTADALLAEVDEDSETARAPADEAVFHVIPMTLLLGYRFELLADRFHVPLVPYARGGIAYGFWVATKGGSRTTNSAGEDSRGGSVGWQANLGLMLRMDFLERAVALDLDRLAGINHTYFFGEWQFSRLDGFGSETAMSVGDDTFTVGVAVEF
nr:MXAN_2562 family outer membrane beta-barrel protein [Pseudenhygromyxa sp. WMMC2535]